MARRVGKERLLATALAIEVALLASAALLALLLAGHGAMAAGPEPVEFREGDLTLKGLLYRPDGAGPFPAVVGMHNCGGLVNTSGTVATRYRDWAQQAAA